METSSPAPRLRDAAPASVLRLGMIVAGIAALVARRFLRDPKFGALVGPLWSWLNRTVQRFGRVRVKPALATARRPRAARPVVPGEGAQGQVATRVRLPQGRGWLVKALGWEAVAYGSQLQTLLAEPEMVALLAAVPAVGRVLRPLGRMLGVMVGPAVVLAARVRKPRVPKPRVKREKPWSPGPIRPPWQVGPKRA